MLSSFVVQTLNGLASASLLFMVGLGLTLIFGVTRIVNFAHGSFYMLGVYVAITLFERLGGGFGFWRGALLAAAAVAVLGVLIETTILRRIYAAPELLQLITTFGLVLVLKDAALYLWGPEDILGPKAPGLKGAILILGRPFPEYDLVLLVLGPLMLLLVWLLLTRTKWGTIVRAATEDREMAAALGVNQALLFTAVFGLGSFLAGLGGALSVPREPANLSMDLAIIADVFVVTVVGGLGSIPGAFVAAVIVSLAKAWCIGIGEQTIGGIQFSFSKLTLVAEFIVMAVVLVVRPWGLFGSPPPAHRTAAMLYAPLPPPRLRSALPLAAVLIGLALLPLTGDRFAVVLMTDIAIFALFAASLGLMMGAGGMASFGHAAYFGAGAYAAAVAAKAGLPFLAAIAAGFGFAALLAVVYGWFCVRLSGVSLAMLTLAFAQITWAIAFQWDAVTGGSNGLVGVWPPDWLAAKSSYYAFAIALAALAILALWRMVHAPFGYLLRAARDSSLRAEAIGLNTRRIQWGGFTAAGAFAGLAGALFVFSKGSLSPELAVDPALHGRADHGAARRCADADRSGPRRGRLHSPTGLDHACDALLAGGARLGDHPFDDRVPARDRRYAQGLAGWRPGTGGMSILSVRDIAKSYGGVHAVAGVSFDVNAGELVALIGPNGAGKTTTFNMVNGQVRPDRGTVHLNGRDVTGMTPRELWRLGVGRTFQITATFGSMTVRENVQVALMSASRVWWPFGRGGEIARGEADAILELVGMRDQAGNVCGALAYGDLKRIELGIAIAHSPRLLLMDEPTAGMAPRERGQIMALAAKLARERSVAVLFTEHDMDVVFGHAQRVLVMDRGALIAEGTPKEVRANAKVRSVYLGTRGEPSHVGAVP